ncbi:MAG: 1,4-alpha-glucan branching protein GlgB [Clostridiales bacterium]|nr:1,4-alpha-glucan branching protein GlgB [Clostridiales bacterium]
MKNGSAPNELPIYLFHQGINLHAQDYFGCHFDQEAEHAVFRTWAPNAQAVSVVGDWNEWSEGAQPMRRISAGGVWEAEADDVRIWQRYKFSIQGADGTRRLKADPFAVHAETSGKTASIVYELGGYAWQDADWMRRRGIRVAFDKPLNIYELHVGSWRRSPEGARLSYTELADLLVPYLVDMGYTHVELLPIMEHPTSRSRGFRISGFYAATSRFGTPHDLMALIDRLHNAGIGVILAWSPSQFPNTDNSLAEFDGAPIYEVRDERAAGQRDWGTRHFDFSRPEVRSFLISNALFWLRIYHADGLRVDNVSAMLYPGGRRGNGALSSGAYAGQENSEAIEFLQQLNKAAAEICPGAMMIAEESSSWPMVTKPVNEGGLGFDYKWNLGWVNDMLDYVSVDPLFRKMVHEKITFSLYYSFDENYILPLHHEESQDGKHTLIEKMPGDYEWKFAGVRAFLGYMMAYPGKKLSFMGNEIGQFREWDYTSSVEWFLLDFPVHKQFQDYVKALNHLYLETPALWEIDNSWDGFQWICADDKMQNIAIFIRRDKNGNEIIVLQNFAPVLREGYLFGVPEEGIYVETLNSDHSKFGGQGNENAPLRALDKPMHGFPFSLQVTVPPLSTVFFRRLSYGHA